MAHAGPRLHARTGVDWHERFDAEERFARMYGLSSFFIGEQRVADGARADDARRARPRTMRIFLCTQIADEARHVAFFDRFYEEVGVLESDNLAGPARGDERAPQRRSSASCSTRCSRPRRPPRRRARGHRDARRGDDALPHGHRGDARRSPASTSSSSYNEEQGTLPGFVEGFNNVARDEHRHVAFGARFLREMAQAGPDATSRRSSACWSRSAPAADGVLEPPW